MSVMTNHENPQSEDWELIKLQAKALIDGATEISWCADPIVGTVTFKVSVPESFLLEGYIPRDLPLRYNETNQFHEEVWVDSDPTNEQQERYDRMIEHLRRNPISEPTIIRSSAQSSEEAR